MSINLNKPYIRWIFFFPAAIICALILSLIANFITGKLFFLGTGISEESFSYKIGTIPLVGVVFGFILIYVGVSIVPQKKHSISIALLTFSILLSVLLMVSSLLMNDPDVLWVIIQLIFVIGGSFYAHQYLKKKNYE